MKRIARTPAAEVQPNGAPFLALESFEIATESKPLSFIQIEVQTLQSVSPVGEAAAAYC